MATDGNNYIHIKEEYARGFSFDIAGPADIVLPLYEKWKEETRASAKEASDLLKSLAGPLTRDMAMMGGSETKWPS